MNYYCHNCNSEPSYLTEVSDPDSAHFNEKCCPNCGSTQIHSMDSKDPNIEQFGTELEQIRNAPPINILLPPISAFAIITHIQLASRHPRADTPITKVAIDTARQMQKLFDPNSITSKVLEMGWNPEYDRTVEKES